MATIYIDTNIFMNESFFRSAQAQAFLKACSLTQVSVVIPNIVIDEVLGNFPKALKSKAKAFQTSQKELGRLIEIDAQDVSIEKEIGCYEDWLYETIEDKGVLIPPYPEVKLKDLVDKPYGGEKPFKDTGDGYKGYLVWLTVKNHIESKSTTPPNFFITNNTRDFGGKDSDGKDVLHPKLSEQIEDDALRPELYTSLKAAFDKILTQNLEDITFNEIPDLKSDDLQGLTEKYLLEDLPQRTAFGYEGIPFSNDVFISGVGAPKISQVALKKVGDEVVIYVTGDVEIEVNGFMDKHSYYMDLDTEEAADVYVVDADWNDHVMAVSASVETAFELSLFYSTESEKVTGYQVILPQEIEDDWYQ